MAYSTPSTQSTGDLITAAIWNQNVVNNMLWMHDSRPFAVVNNSAALGMAAGGPPVTIALSFDTENFDNDNIFSGAAPTKLIPKTAGYYIFFLQAEADNNGVYVEIRKNANTIAGAGTLIGFAPIPTDASSTRYATQMSTYPILMNGTTDHVEGFAVTTTGALRYILTTASSSCFFGCIWVKGS